MKLIVGLGNLGREYANNRHNIGFTCLKHFAKTQGIRFGKKQGQARIGTGEVAGGKVVVARPQTYMNQSGESVSRLIKRFNINPDDLLVIHDDLDLPSGTIRIRRGGSSGGHKGINSIIADLDRQDFIRIRVGIGRPTTFEDDTQNKEDEIIAYVLSDFTPEEKPVIHKVIPRVSEAIYCLLTDGLTAAMNKYN
ncbi:MAG: aminoacyl-tRNA hydrolase [Dehalococcoidales bacterium]|jgi:PTH1 family peptidyl-tRNA hydrolase|nr:aminoacyl-tRNA hydrolase [Dehalococcoidales bacterium]|tara:strand:- start:1403 stop:1984 length:582 start_codon:yes stop_codon:yes gene_type:complete